METMARAKSPPPSEPAEVDLAFGKRLERLLYERRLTQSELALKAGIDPSTVTRLVSGKRRARLEHLEVISKALGVKMSDLAPEAVPEGPSSPVVRPVATSAGALPPGLAEFLERNARKLTEAERDYLTGTIWQHNADVTMDDNFWWGMVLVIRKASSPTP
jgi:transcriptional regulator with XRE-family HTH domain